MLDLDAQWLSNITLTDFSIRLLILLIVICFDRFVSLPSSYHPKLLFKYLTQQLAQRVNKRSKNQKQLAGACTLLLLCCLAIGFCAVIIYFAVYPWFYELMLMLLIVTSKPLLDSLGKIKRSLEHGHKVLAREQLQLLCIRDTLSLSEVGIVKATIETLPQRLITSYFNPILIYAISGIYPTILVTCIIFVAHHCNPKLPKYQYFGITAIKISQVVCLPAQLLVSINVFLLFGAKCSIKQIVNQAKTWHNFGNGLVLTFTAWALNCALGGAVMYQGIKIRRPLLGTTKQPSIKNVDDVYRVQLQLITFWGATLIISLTTSLIINSLTSA